MNNNISKKAVAFLLALSFMCNMCISKNVFANIKNKYEYAGQGYAITCKVIDSWNDGYQLCVSLKNTSQDIIHDWTVSFEMNGKIDNIWNAKIDSEDSRMYEVSGEKYNQDVLPNESIEFGCIISGNACDIPQIYYLESTRVIADSKEYEVRYTVSNDWKTGFAGEFKIKNTSERSIKGWAVEFDWEQNIDNIWNGQIVSHNKNHYIISGETYNQNIETKNEISVGFSCNSGNAIVKPDNFKLIHYEKKYVVEDDTDFELECVKDYAIIEYSEGNCSKSVTNDVKFVNLQPNKIEINWVSSNEAVINPSGKVARGSKDVGVIITAQIIYQGNTYNKEFELTVKRVNDISEDTLKDYSIAQLDRMNKNDKDYEIEVNDFGYIESIYGCYSTVKVDSYESALLSLNNIKSALGIKQPMEELKIDDVKCDDTGYIFKFVQVYEGIEVLDNKVVISSDENGKVDYMKSDYFPINSKINMVPRISQNEAVYQLEKQGYSDVNLENGKLSIINYYGKCSVVWVLEGKYNNSNYEMLVDVHSGDLIYKNRLDLSERIETQGIDLNHNSRSFCVKRSKLLFSNEKYFLEDTKRNIKVYDAHKTQKIGSAELIEHSNNNWDKTQVSAMSNMKEIYDFYKDKLNRISYDDAWFQFTGNTIKVYINTNIEDNAYWNGKGIWVGVGSGGVLKKMSLAVGKDVLAHEFTHAVVQDETSLNKIYCGTPGIINEAYADIFGCYVDNDWEIGEKATNILCLRNIKSPYDSENPIKVNGKNYISYKLIDESNDYGGIHNNSTIISHVAYEMQQHNITKSAMKIWYKSLCLGYSKHTDLYDVRKNIIKSAYKMKCSESDINTIKEIFDSANITKEVCDESYSDYFKKLDKKQYSKWFINDEVKLTGKVVEADKDFDYSNNRKIDLANISSENKELGKSDLNGDYTVSVSEDNPVVVKISKRGYINEKMYVSNINSTKQKIYYCDLVELISESQNGYGYASGFIKNSINGKGIGKLKLNIRRGLNNIYTDSICMIQSLENGYYKTPKLEAGNYCVEVCDDSGDYASTFYNIKIFGGDTLENQNVNVTNSLKKNQMRAVLTWGEKPCDLDAHIKFKLSDGAKGHVFYSDDIYNHNNMCIAQLDVDDTDGFGPETVTINNTETGIFHYYVENYSDEIEMKEGGVIMVKVYFGNSLIPSYTFCMPNSAGKVWEVFEYDSSTGRVTAKNIVK